MLKTKCPPYREKGDNDIVEDIPLCRIRSRCDGWLSSLLELVSE